MPSWAASAPRCGSAATVAEATSVPAAVKRAASPRHPAGSEGNGAIGQPVRHRSHSRINVALCSHEREGGRRVAGASCRRVRRPYMTIDINA
jgi:hypothetical protein